MNQYLKTIQDLLQQKSELTAQDKEALLKAIADADKQWNITDFKLDRTEKVKKTTAILLEETIAELEQKRKAVEVQNKELEIEAALERVRAVAMGMKKREDMLDICRIISEQLESLHVKDVRNVQTAIFDEAKHIYINYEYYRKHDKTFITEVDYTQHPVQAAFADQMLRGKGSFFSTSLEGEKLNEFIEHQKAGPEFVDSFLFGSVLLTWYWYSLGPIAFGISTYSELNEESQEIVKRFRNVFDLSYQRYLDIEKAEAQAREAKIEAALEKIRSRSLAMHHADELKDVITVVREKLKELGIAMEARTVLILTLRKDSKNFTQWVARPEDSSGKSASSCFETPYFDHPIINDFWSTKESGLNFFSKTYTPEQKVSFFKYLFENTDSGKTSEQEKNWILQPSGYAVTAAIENNSAIITSNFSTKLLSDKESEILKRFARVFEQAYIRFLDLQKAEAQAREAQIEAALEKVRSRTMAMQRSTELADVATVLFQQVKALGVPQWTCGFCIWEIGDSEFIWYPGSAEGKILKQSKVPLTEHPIFQSWVESKRRGDEFFIYEKRDEIQSDHYRYMMTVPGLRESLQEMLDAGFTFPAFQIDHVVHFSHGNLLFITYEPFPEMHDVFKRFAKVFEQTYTRFLDLQRAEGQAREAQIEAALEKVRSHSLAMHHSLELKQVVVSLFDRLLELGLSFDGAGIYLFEKEKRNIQLWIATTHLSEPVCIDLPFDKEIENNEINKDLWYAIEKGGHIMNRSYTSQTKNEYFRYVAKYNEAKIPESVRRLQIESDSWTSCFAAEKNSIIVVDSWSGHLTSDEDFQILIRFARVFEQAYIRFLDLQKAERQAREAQIEAALERVRSRSLAMHKSDELQEVVNTVFERLRELGVDFYTAIIILFKEDSKDIEWWLQNRENQQYPKTLVRYAPIAYLRDLFEARQEKKELFTKSYSYKEKNELFAHLFAQPDFKYVSEKQKEFLLKADLATMSVGLARNTGIHLTSYTRPSFSEEENAILKRFAKVFDQAYTRFLDLEKAEAQAREARIEASLEKVRSSAMAMHNSNDISSTTTVVFNELKRLEIESIRCGVALLSKSSSLAHVYAAASSSEGQLKTLQRTIEMTDHFSLRAQYESWLQQRNYFIELEGEALKSYHKLPLFSLTPSYEPSRDSDQSEFGYYIPFSEGLFYAWTRKSYSENEINILTRFKTIIDLTFRRYLDLQKAEARAREAKIEAAMEKVRARAMAMQKPSELVEVAQLLRTEMGLLGVEELETSSIYIHDENNGTTECWFAIQDVRDGEKKLVADHMTINLEDTWVGREMLKFYKTDQKQISIPMKGENRKEWINYCSQHSKLLQGYYGETIPERTYHLLKFSNGYMGAASPGDISAESWDLLRRATNVFSLAYTRFNDLQLAESNAREAVKQSVLDRIRADIASMRTVTDLDRITPLIWNELTILGVPFIRCGVFLMDDSQKLIHTFLSTPDGKAIAAFHLDYDTTKNLTEVVFHWHQKKIYVHHWSKSEFINLADALMKQGSITSRDDYLDGLPQSGFYLHFLPFLQGMLYVGNLTQLNEDEIKILQSVADAFSTAYARYEDFNKLEAAKQQVEKTLEDLKQAQTQLVQSEKMASLGELTAGIAHEIQNPLNFVNNFSDVSNELLEEMKNELEQGNKKDAIALVEDVKQNLEKILHHGRRADAIVKGMLQHSRISSGQKELTDINMLADEYLRLAYHGLRAKDKSFNARFESDFDKSLERINIIPQDIGRVILNLINNAFYSVNEKRRRNNIKGYEPIVRVATKREDGKVDIRVRDNGIGIPPKILDKIFQPFFTTKPTGQGTGLGLSLSYDIIKAHGGEITVDTKEGEGSEFIISIPMM